MSLFDGSYVQVLTVVVAVVLVGLIKIVRGVTQLLYSYNEYITTTASDVCACVAFCLVLVA